MKKKYWMFKYIYECPVCGSYEESLERRYTKKPKDPEKRINYTIDYDWCNE